jgi:hypothetical protein
MLTCEMTCETCFHSHDSFFQEPIAGRDKAGVECWTEEVMMSSVICKAEPTPKFVSIHCRDGAGPDIYAEPEYHTCGLGRWWEDGKWVGLLNAEDAGLEDD